MARSRAEGWGSNVVNKGEGGICSTVLFPAPSNQGTTNMECSCVRLHLCFKPLLGTVSTNFGTNKPAGSISLLREDTQPGDSHQDPQCLSEWNGSQASLAWNRD